MSRRGIRGWALAELIGGDAAKTQYQFQCWSFLLTVLQSQHEMAALSLKAGPCRPIVFAPGLMKSQGRAKGA